MARERAESESGSSVAVTAQIGTSIVDRRKRDDMLKQPGSVSIQDDKLHSETVTTSGKV